MHRFFCWFLTLVPIALALAAAPVAASGERAVRTLAPGVVHIRERRVTPAGPMAINILKADPGYVDIRTLLAKRPGGGFGRAPVSAIARASGAIAAINGSFFSMNNAEPTGLLVIDGQIVSASSFDRSFFGVRYDGSPFIESSKARASVLLDDGRELVILAINKAPMRNQMSLYTPHYGPSTRSAIDPSRVEVAIDASGTVIEASNGNLPIPRGGYVVSAQGRSYQTVSRALAPGTRALVYTKLPGVWDGLRFAVGGGPTIVNDGRVYVTARAERFGSHIASGRAPRTAVGYTQDGMTLLVTVDGRQPKHSVGCTLNELARLMIDWGAVSAINLDGGGSTTMAIGGKAINKVSGGSERHVSNAIGLFPLR